jgi:hypothetical protein
MCKSFVQQPHHCAQHDAAIARIDKCVAEGVISAAEAAHQRSHSPAPTDLSGESSAPGTPQSPPSQDNPKSNT